MDFLNIISKGYHNEKDCKQKDTMRLYVKSIFPNCVLVSIALKCLTKNPLYLCKTHMNIPWHIMYLDIYSLDAVECYSGPQTVEYGVPSSYK